MRKAAVFLAAAVLTGAISRPQANGIPWSPAQIAALTARIDRRLASPVLRGAQIGLVIVDSERGTAIYSRNSTQEFMPASNFKLLTGSAALALLGDAFAFETLVVSDVAPREGTIAGNVYLVGGGDAQLRASDLDSAAAVLAAAGIKRIAGAVIGDATRYDDMRYAPGWLVDDTPYYYAAAVSALELEEGVEHVTIAPGTAIGAPAVVRAWPQSNAFTIDNRIATGTRGSKDTSDIVRPWDAPHTIRLVGSYPLGAAESDDLDPSVPDPPAYALDVFSRALAAHGIVVERGTAMGAAPAGAVPLWSHRSPALNALLGLMWTPSDNLMAELLLKELGRKQSAGPGTYEHGAAAEASYLRGAGVDPASVSISDGSGLSAYDRITPQDLIAILQSDWKSAHRDEVLDALPVAGVRGTLKSAYLGTPAEGAVFAKTGTWTHVTTLSGYAQTRTHGSVTFSFLINQWMGDQERGGESALAAVRAAMFSDIVSM